MDSTLADAWDDQATAYDRLAETAQQAGRDEDQAAYRATASTYRKCARQLRASQVDRSRGIQYGHGNTQTNVF